jgi:hypothetical protein
LNKELLELRGRHLGGFRAETVFIVLSTSVSATQYVDRAALSCGQCEASAIMSFEIVEIVAVTFAVWIVAALFVAARAKRRREAEAGANRRYDGIWH